MQRFFLRSVPLVLSGIAFSLVGCGSNEPATSSSDAAMIEELLNSDGDLAEPADPIVAQGNPTRSVSRTQNSTRDSSGPRGERLELRLQQGDRFPLVKTIEQTLIQKSELAPAAAFTRLELTLAITVEQVTADAILLGVRYSRVSYEHDVAGQRLSFDSGSHQGAVPWDAVPYAGMVGNGFSFWLGRDNSIREMVGYKEFLERCVAQVPLDRREWLMSEISNRFGDDGVANFVDDSIGLLPYDSSVDANAATRVMLGDEWFRERRLMQPVPVHLTTHYRLISINEHTAEIDITGRVASGDASASRSSGGLRISGGHSLGRCIVDRATGLPLDMNLTRWITMKITTSDRQEVTQEKQIVTTIRAFPEARGPVAAAPQPSPIRQVSGSARSVNPNGRNPESTPQSRAVRAVYPPD